MSIDPRMVLIGERAADHGNRFTWIGPGGKFFVRWEPIGGWPRLESDTWDD